MLAKWFLHLLSLIGICIFSLLCIFLLRPQYFIDDIEGYINKKLSTSFFGTVNIGKIEGNFINGFTIGPVEFRNDTMLTFSMHKIYIDPDLSRIVFGRVVLSEVNIYNAYFNSKIIRWYSRFFII